MGRKRISSINIHETLFGKRIIDYLQDNNWHHFTEIKKGTNSPPTTLCKYLKGLVSTGWVKIDKKGKGRAGTSYRLSPMKELTEVEIKTFYNTISMVNNWNGPIGSVDMDLTFYDKTSKRKWIQIESELILIARTIKLNWMSSALRRYNQIVNRICARIDNHDRTIIISFFIRHLEMWREHHKLDKNIMYNSMIEKIKSLGQINKIDHQINNMATGQKRLNEFKDSEGNTIVHMIAKIQSYKKCSYIQALDYAVAEKVITLTVVEKKKITKILGWIEIIEKNIEDYWIEMNKLTIKREHKEPSILLPRMPPLIILDSRLL